MWVGKKGLSLDRQAWGEQGQSTSGMGQRLSIVWSEILSCSSHSLGKGLHPLQNYVVGRWYKSSQQGRTCSWGFQMMMYLAAMWKVSWRQGKHVWANKTLRRLWPYRGDIMKAFSRGLAETLKRKVGRCERFVTPDHSGDWRVVEEKEVESRRDFSNGRKERKTNWR
jgi:hypothetical protein